MKRALISFCALVLSLNISARKPNVILIYADDISADMFSPYKQPEAAKTPHIERMADEGIYFKTFFAQAKVVTPKNRLFVPVLLVFNNISILGMHLVHKKKGNN